MPENKIDESESYLASPATKRAQKAIVKHNLELHVGVEDTIVEA